MDMKITVRYLNKKIFLGVHYDLSIFEGGWKRQDCPLKRHWMPTRTTLAEVPKGRMAYGLCLAMVGMIQPHYMLYSFYRVRLSQARGMPGSATGENVF